MGVDPNQNVSGLEHGDGMHVKDAEPPRQAVGRLPVDSVLPRPATHRLRKPTKHPPDAMRRVPRIGRQASSCSIGDRTYGATRQC